MPHGGGQTVAEGFLQEVVQSAGLALPVVFSVLVLVVYLHIVGLALLSDVVRQQYRVEVVLHPTYLQCHGINVVVRILGAVVRTGKEQGICLVIQAVVHVHVGLGVSGEVCYPHGLGAGGDGCERKTRPAFRAAAQLRGKRLVLRPHVQRGSVHACGTPLTPQCVIAEDVVCLRSCHRVGLRHPVEGVCRRLHVAVISHGIGESCTQLAFRAIVAPDIRIVQVGEIEEVLQGIQCVRVRRDIFSIHLRCLAKTEVDLLRVSYIPGLLLGVVGHVIVPRTGKQCQLAVIVGTFHHHHVRGGVLVETECWFVAFGAAEGHQVTELPRVVFRFTMEEQERLFVDGQSRLAIVA